MSRILSTEGIVLSREPPGERYQAVFLFSPEYGILRVYQRIPGKRGAAMMDLFDEVQLHLQTSSQDVANPQGQLWFVHTDPFYLRRYSELGRNYDTLSHASAFSNILVKNPVHEESRQETYTLLKKALEAFSKYARADIVHFKALYTFARNEGYPVAQEWLPLLSPKKREAAHTLLHRPVSQLEYPLDEVMVLLESLVKYLEETADMVFH